jgi:hypothetical protein
MYYKFHVETLELVNNGNCHTIAKKASKRTDAMMKILSDAIVCGLTIDKIEFVGQYYAEPLCNASFRKYKP